MIDMKGGFLPGLRQPCSTHSDQQHDGPPFGESARGCRSWGDPLPAQAQETEEFGEFHEAFGLFAFLGRKRLASVLTVEEKLQTISNPVRQLQPGEIIWQIDFKSQGHKVDDSDFGE